MYITNEKYGYSMFHKNGFWKMTLFFGGKVFSYVLLHPCENMLPFNFSALFCIRKCLQICEPRSGLLWESVLRFAYLYSMSIGFRELNITNLYYLYKIPSMESRMFYIFYHFIGFHLIVGGIRYQPFNFHSHKHQRTNF